MLALSTSFVGSAMLQLLAKINTIKSYCHINAKNSLPFTQAGHGTVSSLTYWERVPAGDYYISLHQGPGQRVEDKIFIEAAVID